MAASAARTRCARIRLPLAAPRPAAAPRAGGARAPGPQPQLPPVRLCLWWRPACARARAGSTHPPRAWSIQARATGATPPPHPLFLFVPLPPRVPGGSQVPEAGNVVSFVFTWRGEAGSLSGPCPYADYRGGLSGFMGFPNLWSARPPLYQDLNLGEGVSLMLSFFSHCLGFASSPKIVIQCGIWVHCNLQVWDPNMSAKNPLLPYFLK